MFEVRTNKLEKVILISVIIPTRNRSKLLASALDSIVRQTLPQNEFEVLVIDNGSTDSTKDTVIEYQDKIFNLNYYFEEEPGLHRGRHRGLHESSGEILVYADDDIEAFPTWLEAINYSFKDEKTAMVGGNNIPMFLNTPPKWLSDYWHGTIKDGGNFLPPLSLLQLPEGIREFSPYNVWGCNFAIRKKIVIDAKGFHPDGMPKELLRFRGDGEVHIAKYVSDNGFKCLFNSEASVYHKVTPERMTISYFRQRGFSQGISDSFTKIRQAYLTADTNKKMVFLSTPKCIRLMIQYVKLFKIKDKQLKRALLNMNKGYLEGFLFHQSAFKKEQEVRDWVLKDSFI